MENEPYTLEWQVFEFLYREKRPDWYWAVSIISIALAVTAFILNNVLFGILILIASFTLMLHAKKKPRLINVSVSHEGVRTENYFYPFQTLESYWVDITNPSSPKIIFKSHKTFMPHVVVPIAPDVNPEEVRKYLGTYLHEEEQYEPLSEKIMEYLGF